MKGIDMKTIFKIIIVIFILNSIGLAHTADPQNAALLYYQAFLLSQPGTDNDDKLADVMENNIEPNETIIKYIDDIINKNKEAIRLATEASNLQYCDWGLKYSDGFSMELPYLTHIKFLTRIMLSDARILSLRGDYKTALEKCLIVQRMARHSGATTDLSFLLATSMSRRSDNVMRDVLSQMNVDLQTIEWLRDEMDYVDMMPFSFTSCMQKTFIILRENMNKDKAKELLNIDLFFNENCDKMAKRNIAEGDDDFFKQNADFWDNYTSKALLNLELPYPQAYPALDALAKDSNCEEIKDPKKTLTCILCPRFNFLYNYNINEKTTFNANRAAVEIYRIKSQTGKLPEELPADSPKDLFSDKPFIYEKTSDGFILRCQGKDLSKNETYEFKFKVK
jgi:hypothetical protein